MLRAQLSVSTELKAWVPFRFRFWSRRNGDSSHWDWADWRCGAAKPNPINLEFSCKVPKLAKTKTPNLCHSLIGAVCTGASLPLAAAMNESVPAKAIRLLQDRCLNPKSHEDWEIGSDGSNSPAGQPFGGNWLHWTHHLRHPPSRLQRCRLATKGRAWLQSQASKLPVAS
jgi:hypothetical protein